VNRWVTLVERIVRVAEKNAHKTMPSDPTDPAETDMGGSFAEKEGKKYTSTSRAGTPWPCESMNEFCVGFLSMSLEDGEYWQRRFEKYKGDRPEDGDVE